MTRPPAVTVRGGRVPRRRGVTALVVATILTLAIALPLLAQDVQKRRGFSIRITRPVNGEIALGRTRIEATVKAERADLIEAVEFFVGDALIFRDTEAPYECTYDFGPEALARVIRAVAHHRESVSVSDVVVTRRLDLSFAVRVNRVVLNAVVQDRDGHFVNGLGPADLTVLEEGRERQIIDFSLETRPLSVALLLDTSGSMLEKIDDAHAAAVAFIDSLTDEDQAMVIDFADKVFLLEDMTRDREVIRRAIESTSAIGATAIYDAVHSALRRMRPLVGRKAIVLLSDGGDTSSQFSRKRVVEEAKATDVTIYTIGLGTSSLDLSSRGVLRDFAEETGGKAFFPKESSELVEIYRKITDDLRNQYLLTYESPNEEFDGRWIPIEVKAKQGDLTVRARKGYFAIKSSS